MRRFYRNCLINLFYGCEANNCQEESGGDSPITLMGGVKTCHGALPSLRVFILVPVLWNVCFKNKAGIRSQHAKGH